MLVLGLQGSPRKKGNTNYLMSLFMAEAEKYGAKTHVIDAGKKNIEPCKEYIVCEKKGFCPIDDDMKHEIYPLLRRAEVIVPASPVFFYNVTAQLKTLIDRSQTLWARKYKLDLTDPLRNTRKGFLLSLGATKGKNLFEGVHLTMKYFFDAVGASYDGALTYWKIEHPGDMEKHPDVRQDVENAVKTLIAPLMNRKKVLFICRENACRSQMAAAFTQFIAGDRIEALSAGSTPAEAINPVMVEVMKDQNLDVEFRKPRPIQDTLAEMTPDWVISMGCGDQCPFVPGAVRIDWDLPDPAGQSKEFMRNVRDEIEKNVRTFLKQNVE